MKKSEIIKAYVTAIETGQWDFPKGHVFQNVSEIYSLVAEGKTIYDFAEAGAVHFGTITGTILAFSLQSNGTGGYVSQSTRKALSKSIDYAITK
jgi:hypothetical protein